jgi:trimethylamine---corrinoid protein Co-methyltransferase
MDEVISMVGVCMGGVEINDETMALDAIQRVGPDSNFISDEHTLKHFREVWYPRFMDRRNYESWVQHGSQTMADRLNAKVVEILDKHQSPEMAPGAAARVHQFIVDAEKRFGVASTPAA